MSDQFTDEISDGPQRPGHRVVAWATLAVLGAVALGGGAYAMTRGGDGSPAGAAAQLAAATSSPNPSSSASPKTNDGRHGPGGPMMGGPMTRGQLGMGGLFGGLARGGQLLHGEATVQTPDGKTQVVDTQRGTISALDSAHKSLTVTSSDKVSFTYVTDSTTRFIVFRASKPAQSTFGDLKQGDTVEIVAIRSGDTRTAKSIVDGKPTMKNGKGWPGRAHGAPGSSGSSGPSESATSGASASGVSA